MKKLGPSVGITGYSYLCEAVNNIQVFRRAVRAFDNPLVSKRLKLMVGILLSEKKLNGEMNRYPQKYPPLERIPEIISMQQDADDILYTIHYNTKNRDTIVEQIDRMMSILGPAGVDALQLNMPFVNPVKLLRIRRAYPELRIILQIGAGALRDVDDAAGDIFLGQALQSYEDLVDDILIDPSGGVGKEVDIWYALACIADKDFPESIQPNVAGGFDSTNVGKVGGLMRRLGRPVGVDAEAKQRDSEDNLYLAENARYINACVPLIGGAISA